MSTPVFDGQNFDGLAFAHVVVRSVRCKVRLTRPDVAPWLWTRLRRTSPLAISGALMPNHIHVMAPCRGEREAKEVKGRLGSVISGLSRSNNPAAVNVWQPAATKEVVTEPQQIARHVRYIGLNPSRKGLVRCPLEWTWTTHRDVMGAVIDPWVTPERVAAALRQPMQGFRERHHRYVSGDSSTMVQGTPMPLRHDGDVRRLTLAQAIGACTASAREGLEGVERPGVARRQFLGLADLAGWSTKMAAATCGIAPKTVRWYLGQPLAVHEAVWLCLGDPRLFGAR